MPPSSKSQSKTPTQKRTSPKGVSTSNKSSPTGPASNSHVERLQHEVRFLLGDAADLLTPVIEGKRIDQMKYQSWYSKAHLVMRRALPERSDEFEACYRPLIRRIKVDAYNFTISDVFKGITPAGWPPNTSENVLSHLLQTQLMLLNSALDVLEGALTDMLGLLRAELFDSELDASDELRKKGHLRGAGAVAGVVLESHLAQIATHYSVKVSKKNPTVSDLNDPLRNAGIYDTPQWRKIQHLADLRNLCSHSKDREPTGEEVIELINGVKGVIKTIN